jgi:alpha-N-acetylglucosamine transferase
MIMLKEQHRRIRLLQRPIVQSLFLLACLLMFLTYTRYHVYSRILSPNAPPSTKSINPPGDPEPHKYAFATFLGAPTQTTSLNDEDDPYFMNIRQLVYKLLHSGKRTLQIPFLVLCTSAVSASKRTRLEADGATIIKVEDITSSAIVNEEPRWRDALTKLRLFELTSYSKICYLDADIFVATLDLHEIFSDALTPLQRTLSNPSALREDEAPLPETYLMAGHNDKQIPTYMNAGFFIFHPSVEIFNHYLSLLDKGSRFEIKGYVEQGIFNYAHRLSGNMPWTELPQEWYGKMHHDKYWKCEEEEGCPFGDYVVGDKWTRQRESMRTYWRLRGMGWRDGRSGSR